MLLWALMLLAAYALGSVSGSLVLGHLRGVDIRGLGSGNAGGTNAYRTQGWRFGVAVVLFDVVKGAVATLLMPFLFGLDEQPPQFPQAAAGLAAVIGHILPVWHGFRGGKGAATVFGVYLALLPLALIPMFVCWLLVLIYSGIVSLATLVVALLLPIISLWLANTEQQPALLSLSLAVTALVAIAHRANITRLRQGIEHRFERARLWHRWRDRQDR